MRDTEEKDLKKKQIHRRNFEKKQARITRRKINFNSLEIKKSSEIL